MRMAEAAGLSQDNLPLPLTWSTCYGEALESIPVQFRTFGLGVRFGGPVVTLKCFEDNACSKPPWATRLSRPGASWWSMGWLVTYGVGR